MELDITEYYMEKVSPAYEGMKNFYESYIRESVCSKKSPNNHVRHSIDEEILIWDDSNPNPCILNV